jgi:hypothetical protein
VTPAREVGKVAWTVKDFFGTQVAKGDFAPKDGNELSFRLDRRGCFLLDASAWVGDKEVDSARAAFAVLEDRDFSSAGDSPFGIGSHFGQWYQPDIVPLIARAGIREVRDDVYWNVVEQQKDVFAFPQRYESFMKALAEAKINVHLNLAYGNKFHDDGKAPYTEEGFTAYARYGAEVLKHYPQVRSAEVWNEWNSPGFCPGPAASKPDVYLELLNHASAAIKKARPDAKVVGCSTTGLWWGGYLWLERFFGLKDSLRAADSSQPTELRRPRRNRP